MDKDGRIVPIVVGMGFGMVVGGILGYISNPDAPWDAAWRGALIGGISTGVGIITGGIAGGGFAGAVFGSGAAGASGTYMRFAADNYLSGRGLSLNGPQYCSVLLSGALSAVIGGGVGKFLLSSGVDPSKAEEMILDVAIGLAGEAGIAASEMFYKGATDAADWGERVFGQHVNDLDQQ